MNRYLLYSVFYVLSGLFATTHAQNLVPNSDFESYSHCPDFGAGEKANTPLSAWYDASLGHATDYFNLDFTNCSCASCGCSLCGADNGIGYQQPHSGKGYHGLFCVDYRFPGTGHLSIDYRNYREYIGVKLLNTLVAGKKYKVSAYISLANTSYYAINRFGFYFSPFKIYSPGMGVRINAIPQVTVPDKFYSDTLNWEKIEGEFIAQGGEEYLALGNFSPIADVDTLFVNPDPYLKHRSYYYIDDVVVECVDCTVGIHEPEQKKNILYNTSNNTLNISTRGTLLIYNMLGDVVLQQKVQQDKTISVQYLPPGVYVWQLQAEQSTQQGKFVVGE